MSKSLSALIYIKFSILSHMLENCGLVDELLGK